MYRTMVDIANRITTTSNVYCQEIIVHRCERYVGDTRYRENEGIAVHLGETKQCNETKAAIIDGTKGTQRIPRYQQKQHAAIS